MIIINNKGPSLVLAVDLGITSSNVNAIKGIELTTTRDVSVNQAYNSGQEQAYDGAVGLHGQGTRLAGDRRIQDN